MTFTEQTFMNSIGYDLVKDDGVYAIYANKPGIIVPGYGIMPKAKRIIYFNRGYDLKNGVFCNIREDGDTRNVFYGMIDTADTLKLILELVR